MYHFVGTSPAFPCLGAFCLELCGLLEPVQKSLRMSGKFSPATSPTSHSFSLLFSSPSGHLLIQRLPLLLSIIHPVFSSIHLFLLFQLMMGKGWHFVFHTIDMVSGVLNSIALTCYCTFSFPFVWTLLPWVASSLNGLNFSSSDC